MNNKKWKEKIKKELKQQRQELNKGLQIEIETGAIQEEVKPQHLNPKPRPKLKRKNKKEKTEL